MIQNECTQYNIQNIYIANDIYIMHTHKKEKKSKLNNANTLKTCGVRLSLKIGYLHAENPFSSNKHCTSECSVEAVDYNDIMA